MIVHYCVIQILLSLKYKEFEWREIAVLSEGKNCIHLEYNYKYALFYLNLKHFFTNQIDPVSIFIPFDSFISNSQEQITDTE